MNKAMRVFAAFCLSLLVALLVSIPVGHFYGDQAVVVFGAVFMYLFISWFPSRRVNRRIKVHMRVSGDNR